MSQYKHPLGTSTADRARAQNLGLDITALAQGVNFFHAGVDMLRSKSLDRDSYNSGDWFNHLDFTYQTNNWGVGLPVASKNQAEWPFMQPLLANPALGPVPADIAASVIHLQEILQIRASSPLFSLQTAAEIQDRVAFHNTGPGQIPGLIVMSIADPEDADIDSNYQALFVLVNANDEAQSFTIPAAQDQNIGLHAVQVNSADALVQTSSFDPVTGTFMVPGRTTAVFVQNEEVPPTAEELINQLMAKVDSLVDQGELKNGDGQSLNNKLEAALKDLDKGKQDHAIKKMNDFIKQVEKLISGNKPKLDPVIGAELIQDAQEIIAAIDAQN
jgi:hypothetical protein